MQPSGLLVLGSAALLPFPDKYFHACVTSPPYWGLRKYTGEQQRVWGGDAECEHEFVERKYYTMRGASSQSSEAFSDAGEANAQRLKDARWMTDSICQKCGAWYGALGLEPTPELHIEHMVEIFREIRRVLRDDGTVWLNYGDCFAGSGGENANTGLTAGKHRYRMTDDKTRSNLYRNNPRRTKIAQGNLMMMPHKVAIALQSDGWIVRNDVVWWKRNPMPESVNGWRWERSKTKTKSGDGVQMGDPAITGKRSYLPQTDGGYKVNVELAEWDYGDDYVLRKGSWRHTRAHEYIFQLVKGPKMKYYSNQEAARVPHDQPWRGRQGNLAGGHRAKGFEKEEIRRWRLIDENKRQYNPAGRNPRSVLDVPTDSMDAFYHWLGERMGVDLYEAIELFRQEVTNPNDVLDVPTQSYKGAHFATYPVNLIAPLIRASCPKRCCPECGAPWAPVVARTNMVIDRSGRSERSGNRTDASGTMVEPATSQVLDYRPTCSCDCGDHIPGIVLDPFIGSGTTGAVARELGRRWVGLEISMEYLDQQAKIRTKFGQRTGQLDHLPLFEELFKPEDIDK